MQEIAGHLHGKRIHVKPPPLAKIPQWTQAAKDKKMIPQPNPPHKIKKQQMHKKFLIHLLLL